MTDTISPSSPVILLVGPERIQKDVTAYESAMLITLVDMFDGACVLGRNVSYGWVTKNWPPEVLRHVGFKKRYED